MEAETIIGLVGSVGLPGGILILLIFLSNKHLPGLLKHFQAIELELARLTTSINLLLVKIEKSIK